MLKIINDCAVKFIFKTIVNKDEVMFIAKLFTLSVFADRKINALELNDLKKELEEYINLYYTMLNDTFKKILIEYLYKESLKMLEELKVNDEYYIFLQKEVVYEIKVLKKQNKCKRLEHIITMIKHILESDKIFTEEEKEFLDKMKKEVENDTCKR